VALRFPIVPMKATLASLPPSSQDHEWAYEIKFDGFRTLAFVEGGRTRWQSSSGADVTSKYPELDGFAAGVNAGGAIIDGELVVLDGEGRPRFELMQRHESQVAFYAFDVLQIDGTDTVGLPYEQRRALLTALLETGANWMVPGHRVGDGAALLTATGERGLEGIMAKRLGSLYLPGQRSANWRKVKHRVRVELAVVGFTMGEGARASTFGALLLGRVADDGRLLYAGGVGSGFTDAVLGSLRSRLDGLVTPTCPLAVVPSPRLTGPATWVQPSLTAVVDIAEFTNDGHVRHAVFVSLSEGFLP
jgi:bifunctional non-homologous end joining protein LigD